MIKKYPVVTYFIITFILSWLFWTIPILNAAGIYRNESLNSIYGFGVGAPILVTIFLTIILSGSGGIKELLFRFTVKGVKLKWYLAVVAFPVSLCLAALLLQGMINGQPLNLINTFSPIKYMGFLLLFSIFALLEETGWRGFVLPRMRKYFNPFIASIILGTLWGIWHFPKLMSEGVTDVLSFIVFEIAVITFSVLISWIYENTNGSTTLAVLAHASLNASLAAPDKGIIIGNNSISIIYLILFITGMAIVLLLNGQKLKSRHYLPSTEAALIIRN